MLFKIKRLPEGRRGLDMPGDWFAIEAVGNKDLVQTGQASPSTLVTAFNVRSEAKKLCQMLNNTYKAFHKE